MAIIKTRHFAAPLQRPKEIPNGSSLEEQMNAFLAILPLGMVMDIQTSAIHSQSATIHYTGLVIYQE